MTPEMYAVHKLFKASTRPLTARKVAEKTDTYPATALRRIEALQEELKRDGKERLKKTSYREGRRGPPSTAWVLEVLS